MVVAGAGEHHLISRGSEDQIQIRSGDSVESRDSIEVAITWIGA